MVLTQLGVLVGYLRANGMGISYFGCVLTVIKRSYSRAKSEKLFCCTSSIGSALHLRNTKLFCSFHKTDVVVIRLEVWENDNSC